MISFEILARPKSFLDRRLLLSVVLIVDPPCAWILAGRCLADAGGEVRACRGNVRFVKVKLQEGVRPLRSQPKALYVFLCFFLKPCLDF